MALPTDDRSPARTAACQTDLVNAANSLVQHPLLTPPVVLLALADAKHFAMRRLRCSLGAADDELCQALQAVEQLSPLLAVIDRVTAELLERRPDQEARSFVAAMQARLAYVYPAARDMLHPPALLQRAPVRVTLV